MEMMMMVMSPTVKLFRVWAARMGTFLTLSCLSQRRLRSRWIFPNPPLQSLPVAMITAIATLV